jgi:hypothetical protein
MGEGTNTAGGYTVPPGFYAAVIRQTKEFSGFLDAFEQWESTFGNETVRPVAAFFSEGSEPTENTAFTDGPYPTLAQQSWGNTPIYAGSMIVSNQVIMDAFRNVAAPDATYHVGTPSGGYSPSPVADLTPDAQLDALVYSGLGESIGRAVAPAAQTLVYSTINGVGAASGAGGYLQLGAATPVTFSVGSATTELNAGTISLDTAAQMIGLLDESYLPTASWYFTGTQWSGMLRQADANKHLQIEPSTGRMSLYNVPVTLTSQATAAAASTVAGPVLGDLSKAFTLRTASHDFLMMRSTERYAEFMQTYYRGMARLDVLARDSRAVIGVRYGAS